MQNWMGEDYDEKAILSAEFVSHSEELLGTVVWRDEAMGATFKEAFGLLMKVLSAKWDCEYSIELLEDDLKDGNWKDFNAFLDDVEEKDRKGVAYVLLPAFGYDLYEDADTHNFASDEICDALDRSIEIWLSSTFAGLRFDFEVFNKQGVEEFANSLGVQVDVEGNLDKALAQLLEVCLEDIDKYTDVVLAVNNIDWIDKKYTTIRTLSAKMLVKNMYEIILKE